MRYLPFLNGVYSVAPGLSLMNKAVNEEDKLIFQIDEHYHQYRENKSSCREEEIAKYYGEFQFSDQTAAAVNRYIVNQLIKEHPTYFSIESNKGNVRFTNLQTGEELTWKEDWLKLDNPLYHSLFDALCCQVQEDIAICQLTDKQDQISAIHVCSPSYWDPSEKLGQPFNSVHAPVPGMEKTMPHYFSMLEAVVNKGPFSRFAWGLTSDDRLNHHHIPPPGYDPLTWAGRIYEQTSQLFIRTERQTMVGFPDCNAFLFTIRTYFYPVKSLLSEEKHALMEAVESMSPDALIYKGLSGKTDMIRKLLEL